MDWDDTDEPEWRSGEAAHDAPPLRPAVEAARARIDRWWDGVTARTGYSRKGGWMELPDRVRRKLTGAELDEWHGLQAQYRDVDELPR